jgi:hypothetical protein
VLGRKLVKKILPHNRITFSPDTGSAEIWVIELKTRLGRILPMNLQFKYRPKWASCFPKVEFNSLSQADVMLLAFNSIAELRRAMGEEFMRFKLPSISSIELLTKL